MSKNVCLSFVALVCSGFAAPYAHAQFGAGPANLELAKLADDLYAITNPFVPGVTTALITNDGVLLVDYAGGGSAKEWTATIDRVLELPFDTVVPGHGRVVPRSELRKFRDSTVRLVELPADLVRQGKSRAEIEAAMRSEFGWQDLHVQFSLDGLINEIRSTR